MILVLIFFLALFLFFSDVTSEFSHTIFIDSWTKCGGRMIVGVGLISYVRVVACYFMSREFAAFRLIFYNGNRNDMLSEASNVSIASDDDQIKAHK